MFDVVDTAWSYWRALVVCLFLQESFKVKESSLHEILNAGTAFSFGGAVYCNQYKATVKEMEKHSINSHFICE